MIKEVNLTELQTPAKKGHAEIVEELERLLQLAKDGEIDAVAVATVSRDENGKQECWIGHVLGLQHTLFTLIAGTEFLKRDLVDHTLERQ